METRGTFSCSRSDGQPLCVVEIASNGEKLMVFTLAIVLTHRLYPVRHVLKLFCMTKALFNLSGHLKATLKSFATSLYPLPAIRSRPLALPMGLCVCGTSGRCPRLLISQVRPKRACLILKFKMKNCGQRVYLSLEILLPLAPKALSRCGCLFDFVSNPQGHEVVSEVQIF
jgi:hypothetical protein